MDTPMGEVAAIQVSPEIILVGQRKYRLSRRTTKPKKKKKVLSAYAKALRRKKYAAVKAKLNKSHRRLKKLGGYTKVSIDMTAELKAKLDRLCEVTGYSQARVIGTLLSIATAGQVREAVIESPITAARVAGLAKRAAKLGATP